MIGTLMPLGRRGLGVPGPMFLYYKREMTSETLISRDRESIEMKIIVCCCLLCLFCYFLPG